MCNAALLGRVEGVLSCWVPACWWSGLRSLEVGWWITGLVVLGSGVWIRVGQEERMLRRRFGGEWVGWHGRTARFVPWVL